MDQIFSEFLTNIDNARSDDEAWDALCASATGLGFNRAIYLYYPDAAGDELGEPIFRTTYAQDWMDYYLSAGYSEVDVTVRRGIEAGHRPLVFDVDQYIDMPPTDEDDLAMLAMYDARNEGGCSKVYGHRLFHGSAGLGALGLVSDQLDSRDFAAVVHDHAATLSAMIHIAHTRLSQGLIGSAAADTNRLSGRQQDVLSGIALGLSYKQIAHRFGISENTVAFHSAELRRKLNCSNSREILSEAYRLGMLKSL